MPLHVNISVNNQQVDTIHIGRTELLASPDQTSGYLVVRDSGADVTTAWDGSNIVDYMVDWKDGIPFSHKYSDGALVCIRKAIEALEEQGNVL